MKNSFGFEQAHAFVMQWEGALSDHKADAGGVTNYGISQRFLKNAELDLNNDGSIDALDVRGLGVDDAARIYKKYFWDTLHCAALPAPLALVLFDGAVNMGARRASQHVQAALNESAAVLARRGQAMPARLEEDGKVGPATLGMAEAIDVLHASQHTACTAVKKRLTFYRELCAAKPSQKVFLRGWERRCKALLTALTHLGCSECSDCWEQEA